MSRVRFRTLAGLISSPPCRTVSEAQRASYPLLPTAHFPEGKRPELEADRSFPFSVEINEAQRCISAIPHAFTVWCLNGGVTLPRLSSFTIMLKL
jgi:hypothetical protein